jgi:hypothetical protein
MSGPFASARISLEGMDAGFRRADLVFHGLDHSGPSYEVRIFFNQPDATADTPRTAEGYVGSFFMFGHGGCAGQPGHCEVPEARRPFDRRPPHQLTPASRWVIVTEALRRVVREAEGVVLTAVAVAAGPRAEGDVPPPERVALVTYD